MTDFLEDLPDEAPLVAEFVGKTPEVIPGTAREILRDVAKEIADETVRVNKDVLHFADIDPEQLDPPPEWIRELGHEGAHRRLRTAKYALMSAKDAPVALKIAAQLGGNIIKAKASERNVENTLNIIKVHLTAPTPVYPELEVESGD